jgi:hypothetical protein
MHKHGLIAFNHAIAAEPREQMMHRSKERAYPGKAEVFGAAIAPGLPPVRRVRAPPRCTGARRIAMLKQKRKLRWLTRWCDPSGELRDQAGTYVNLIASSPTKSLATRRSGGRGPAKNGLPRPSTIGRK